MIHLSAPFRFAAILLAALVCFSTPTSARSQSADVRLEFMSGGFILGLSGGSGVLIYKGKRYPLNIGGVSLGATIGISKVRLGGRAYNLRNVSDISGAYTAAEVGYAVVSGRRTARLKNSRGVVLELSGRETGLQFSADLSGMQLSLR